MNEKKLPSISVVVPVYNSEGTIEILSDRISKVLKNHSSKFELILINDGSEDRSWELISKLANKYSWVHGINLMRNYGQHNALLCGVRAAKYELIITMDDDLQNPPEEMPHLINKIKEGYEVVYGTPKMEQHGLFRDLVSIITKLVLQNAMGVKAARNISSYRIFRKNLRNAFSNYDGPYVTLDVLLSWGTKNFSSVVVEHEKRNIGKSTYNFKKLSIHVLNMVTGFTVVPIRLASFIGFLFTLFGFIIFLYVILNFLIFGTSVQGFTFLASIIAIFSGAQLFSLGIIGEYLGRMHFRAMNKPTYVIRDELNSK